MKRRRFVKDVHLVPFALRVDHGQILHAFGVVHNPANWVEHSEDKIPQMHWVSFLPRSWKLQNMKTDDVDSVLGAQILKWNHLN